jgi:hypothetical protein
VRVGRDEAREHTHRVRVFSRDVAGLPTEDEIVALGPQRDSHLAAEHDKRKDIAVL